MFLYGDHGVYPLKSNTLEHEQQLFPDALLSRSGSFQSAGMGQRNSYGYQIFTEERFAQWRSIRMIRKAPHPALGVQKYPNRQDFLVDGDFTSV